MTIQAEAHQEFGQLVCKRTVAGLWNLGGVLLLLAAIGLCVVKCPTMSHGHPSVSWVRYAGVVAAAAVLLVAPALYLLYRGMEVFEFYERGVVGRRGERETRQLAYAEVTTFQFNPVRAYVHGVYASTNLRMKIASGDGRRFDLSTRYKEKPSLLSRTILVKNFTCNDEMEVVKQLIAEDMAARWLKEIGRGGSVEWCYRLILTPRGLADTTSEGKEVVTFPEMTGNVFKDGWFYLFKRGVEKSFIGVPAGAPNFWPGLMVLVQIKGGKMEEPVAA